MAWKHNGRIIQIGKAWIADDNTKHPRGWVNWSADLKKTRGLVWEDDPVIERFDDRFYWAKGIEKKLDDENVVDDDGKAVIDSFTGKQMINRGLKYQWIEKIKSSANSLLTVSDWYVIRKSETDIAIPSDISKYRSDVRTASKTIEDKINACSKLSEFIALFDVPVDSDGKVTGKAPIHDFPDEV
tara:strand:+ start:3095 stop:3649 length:555 start_codon:yes stop_codon:yes gene_type:complete